MQKINQALTSMEVAEMIGREHKELLRSIRLYLKNMDKVAERTNSPSSKSEYFTESSYDDANGQNRPCYLVTKKGCEFIAHKMNGIKGTEFTMRYIDRFHEMEDEISTSQLPTDPMKLLELHYEALKQVGNKVEAVGGKVGVLENRIVQLEDTMTLDYGQQCIIGETVNRTVIKALGGQDTPAYREIGRKVFAECNRDLKAYFKVNARANVPKKRFDEAVEYARKWKPCTNTAMRIAEHNAQQTLDLICQK